MSEKSSKFLGKISPLIEGQLPDFIRDENPLFVKFVKDYYKFLEAGKMELTATNDYIKYETETVSYVLNDEGDEIDIPNYLSKALVCYVKARLAEDQMNMEAKEYYMRMFREKLEKHDTSRVWGKKATMPSRSAIR